MLIYNPIPPSLTPQQIEVFWSFVDKSPGQGPKGECWEWKRGRSKAHYGHYGVYSALTRKTRQVATHRLAFFLSTGVWPPLVMHSCDWPPCCRPEHLGEGTPAKNAADAKAKGRLATGDRHGLRLHPECVARGDRHGWKTKPERVPRGENSGRAKLSNAQALEIRARFAAGETHKEIAPDYPTSVTNVYAVVQRRTFRHI